jgi:hypothetical protein
MGVDALSDASTPPRSYAPSEIAGMTGGEAVLSNKRMDVVTFRMFSCEHRIYFTRITITSVDLIRAAAVWPTARRISRTASAVMIDVRC